MRLLLTDGSGLTSRQVATLADRAGHHVEVLSPTVLGPARFTRHVRRLHHVPPFGTDPFGWLDAALAVLEAGSFDVLVPTQEQVGLLARERARIEALGVAVPVPSFAALREVQDKVAQARTLARLGLPHPATTIVADRAALAATALPAFVKVPIGTASHGVRHVRTPRERDDVAAWLDDGPVVVQAPVDGPLVMVQAVFDRGRLVAWHANLREQEGANGGASVKRSVTFDAARPDLVALGAALEWHGALSLDAILGPDGHRWIDVNPRLVEPGNAAAAGVDLLGALLAVAAGRTPERQPAGRPGVGTHQLLLGVLGAAQRRGRRRDVARELVAATVHRAPYGDSREELTPTAGDRRAALPVALVAAATLVHPAAQRWFTGQAVSAYALTPAAWRSIVGSGA